MRGKRGYGVRRAIGSAYGTAKRIANTPTGKFIRNKLVAHGVSQAFKIMGKTKTKTKSRVPFRNVKVEGTGGQLSAFRASKPASKAVYMIKKITPSKYLYWSDAMRLTGTPGVQTATYFPFFTGGQYIAGLSSETQYNDMASMLQQVAGDPTLSTATQRKTAQFVVEGMTGSVKLQNQDTGNVEIVLYDVVCKADTSFDALQSWYTGLNDQANVATYTGTTLPVGCVPQLSSFFNTHWKVKQKTRIVLGQGQSHVHQITLKPNRLFKGEEIQDGDAYISGLSYITLVVANGLPANDSTTVSQVSTGAVNVDIVYTKQMKYTYCFNNQSQWSQYQSRLPTAFTVGESIMDIGSGTKTVDAPA